MLAPAKMTLPSRPQPPEESPIRAGWAWCAALSSSTTKEKPMHPIAFVIGSLTIRWYGIMVALAIAVGVTAMYFESRRQGINADYVLDMAIAAVIGGILGARIGWIMTSGNCLLYTSDAAD